MILAVSKGIQSAAHFFSLLLIFAFVCVITYVCSKYIAKLQQGTMLRTGNMELIESFRLSPGKYIQIVRVGKRYLALAICKDTVTVLSEVSEDEIQITKKQEQISFKELLEKARKRADKNE